MTPTNDSWTGGVFTLNPRKTKHRINSFVELTLTEWKFWRHRVKEKGGVNKYIQHLLRLDMYTTTTTTTTTTILLCTYIHTYIVHTMYTHPFI